MKFPEYYIQKAGSEERIANKNVAQIKGKYDLLAVHVNTSCYGINRELKKILKAKKGQIEERVLIKSGEAPDFLKPTKTDDLSDWPPEFKGNKQILTGWDLSVCIKHYYELMLSKSLDETIEINIPFGAAEYRKLEQEGGREGLDNILYFSLIKGYFKYAVGFRGSAALYFDGKLIDFMNKRSSSDLKTVLRFYSTTKKFLESGD
ncbi:MAG: hypothetical protein ISS23_03825 [Nanoarchaeota archaeon]|nr:hypothetical protein [Nanoarchaeota archaeon]